MSLDAKSKKKGEKGQKRQKWVITCAWPYVNATPHLGNMIGSVLSGDVFVRYLRLKGDEAIYVSGSDAHGTPVSVEAIKLGVTPEELATKKHAEIVKIFKDWNISFDNYTTTQNPTHIKFTQDFYTEVQKNGFIFDKEHEAFYCPEDDFFLPDRFIEGICPHCGQPGARGDQCISSSCGKVLEPEQLREPHCKICLLNNENKLTTPIKKKTRHWYLDFPKLQDTIKNFIVNNKIISANARSMCLNSINSGIPPRAITRDLKWGIPAPFKGAENKTVYVWFEAVLGYISAVKEWADKIKKKPELFNHFWNDPETKTVFFIGKDNIIFHLLVFPGLVIGFNKGQKENNKLPMPFNVSSTEFLNYENDKFSKSQGIGIWNDEALEIAPVDYWRYSLIRNRPEIRDVSFVWSEFERNINELNDKIGNFVHRTLTFIYNRFEGKIPPMLKTDKDDDHLLNIIKMAPKSVGDLLDQFRLKDALGKIVEIAGEGNVYLNSKAPWKIIKVDKERAGHVFNICVQLSRCIALLLAPFCPESADKILKNIGCKDCVADNSWDDIGNLEVKAGQIIDKPVPIFKKIPLKDMLLKFKEIRKAKGEDFNIPESVSGIKLGDNDETTPTKNNKEKNKKIKDDKISHKFFQKFNFITVRVQKVEKLPKKSGNNIFKFVIEFKKGDTRSLIIESKLKSEELQKYEGKDLVYFSNLKEIPAKMGQTDGFLLGIGTGMKKAFLMSDKPVEAGSPIR